MKNQKRKTRTLAQNGKYWAFLRELSDELVAHGVDLREAIHVPIMATPEILHDKVTKPLIQAKDTINSTTKLDTVQIGEICELISKVFAERTEGEVDVRWSNDDFEGIDNNTQYDQEFTKAVRDF